MIGGFGLVLLSHSPVSDVTLAGHHQSLCALSLGILVLISFEEDWLRSVPWLQSSFSGYKTETEMLLIREHIAWLALLNFTSLVLAPRWSSDLLFSAAFKNRYLHGQIPIQVYRYGISTATALALWWNAFSIKFYKGQEKLSGDMTDVETL